jgi:hypothetical protein
MRYWEVGRILQEGGEQRAQRSGDGRRNGFIIDRRIIIIHKV